MRELEDHYTYATVAQKLGVTRKTVQRLVASGKLHPIVCLGPRRRIPASTFDVFVRERHA